MNTKLIYACLLFCLVNYVVGYTISGNQLYGPNGGSVRLRGIDRPSFEWSATGESASLADYQLMANWGFNVVRLAMNQDFWLSGSSTYSSGYKSVIAQQVAWIKQCGMGVILDLHWSDQGNLQISGGAAQQVMADTNSITFWTQVATAYKNDAWVMFELYNEPHDVSWSIWRDGGSSNGFTVAGMQQLYNAVRATGANNVVLVGGLNWAFDLSGVSNGYALTGTNIAYATHPYDYDGKQSGDWDAAFGNLAATYPVVMTEFGQYCYTDGYVSTLLAYAERKAIHWTAWAWYPGGCSFPAIINDWTGTPTSPVGALVKSYLTSSSTSSSSSSTSGSTATTKPATGATSAPTSAPATSAPATSGSTIFDNGLASGWSDWSWATRSLTNTNPVYSGSYSISFTLSNYGGIYFHTSNGISVGTYNALQFYTNGPSANIQVKLYDSSGPIGTAVSLPSSSSSGSWTLQSVSLSSFGLSSTTQFYGVVIIYNSSGSGGTMYIDNLMLATSSSSTPATAAPTTKPTTPATSAPATAAPTTKPATAAPTTKPATAAPTTKPTTPATSAPATSPPSTGSGCSASSVKVTQAVSSSWVSGSDTVYQYNLAIQNTCTTKTLTSVTFSVSGWHPANFWNLQVSGTNTLTTASYVTVAPSSTYSSAGYQNVGGPATFTVTSATFQ